ncbi:ABC transporter permease [Haliangium ochraceum]|uniref:Molybdenum transport system permease n=1 Tax=Haliangium ochraceum (strain DSM 14365 / JCM 11303 / SMP-2) TaxID=502025 RepID=D0LM96_HALO1|nr:ABC transporter permease [Haliangium ochraceum]ACY16802.1 molybdate ABC transporter, inner membrane subunit [Haliangium ochraceum DSM 14365]
MRARGRANRLGRVSGLALALALLLAMLLPLAVLLLSSSPQELLAGARHRLFAPALWLSARTTSLSLALVVLTGTPLAWWLASSRTRLSRVLEVLVDVPIVLPPAVVGVALLQSFGRRGLLGPQLEALGVALPFSSAAVVLAQVVVSAPFYVQAAANAFRKVELDLVLVARTLGASSASAFFRVAVPVALPGLLGGAALAWARSLGEFGATLLFAGNLSGRTQTMPLAIYTALESDVRAALALALVLAGASLVLLLALRLGPRALSRMAAGDG